MFYRNGGSCNCNNLCRISGKWNLACGAAAEYQGSIAAGNRVGGGVHARLCLL